MVGNDLTRRTFKARSANISEVIFEDAEAIFEAVEAIFEVAEANFEDVEAFGKEFKLLKKISKYYKVF